MASRAGVQTSLRRQYSVLAKRDGMVALRDPTLYHLQLVLHIFYGFFIGLAFYQLRPVLDHRLNYLPGAAIWVLMLNSYIHVFKVCMLLPLQPLHS